MANRKERIGAEIWVQFSGGFLSMGCILFNLSKRTCSVGGTIEESEHQRYMYDRSETTISGRNLGAKFRGGIFPGEFFFPPQANLLGGCSTENQKTKEICMLGKKQYDMAKHSLSRLPPAQKMCLRGLCVFDCVCSCLCILFVCFVCVFCLCVLLFCFVCASLFVCVLK